MVEVKRSLAAILSWANGVPCRHGLTGDSELVKCFQENRWLGHSSSSRRDRHNARG
jgi:hypothetical protein